MSLTGAADQDVEDSRPPLQLPMSLSGQPSTAQWKLRRQARLQRRSNSLHFEQAVNSFLAIEKRRLEKKENWNKMLHERELKREREFHERELQRVRELHERELQRGREFHQRVKERNQEESQRVKVEQQSDTELLQRITDVLQILRSGL